MSTTANNTVKPTDAAAANTAAAVAKQQQTAASNSQKKPGPNEVPKTAAADKPTAAPKAPVAKAQPQAEAETPKAPAKGKTAPRQIISTKAAVSTNMMLTLDLTGDFEPANLPQKNNLSKALTKVADANGAMHNLYAPFRGVSEKTRKKDPAAARGLIRSALSSVIAITYGEPDATYVGTIEDVGRVLESLASQLRDRVQTAIGFQPDDVVFSQEILPELAEGEVADLNAEVALCEIKFGDLIRVSAWASIGDLNVADPESTLAANIIVNLTIRAGSLFHATELDSSVMQAITFMETVNSKVGSGQSLMVGVLNRANAVGDAARRALFDSLAEAGFDAVDRRDLESDSGSDLANWLCGYEELDSKLLVKDADILHMNVLGGEEEEAAEDDGDEAGE